MKGKINELPNIDASKYSIDENGNVLRDKRITDNDKCCICEKVLFINGDRQTDLCYQLGLQRKRILKDGSYADGSDSRVFICKSCFSRNNNEKIMKALWKEHKITKKIRKARGEE